MNRDECFGLEILPEDLEGIGGQVEELVARGWSERAARSTVKVLAGLRAKKRERRERVDPPAWVPRARSWARRWLGCSRGTDSTTVAIVPLGAPAEIELDALAPWVRELTRWLGPGGEWLPTLAGLICWAPPGLLDDVRHELGRDPVTLVPWTLNSIVRHALLPLAELSLMDGQPVIPELGATLVTVLADPRLELSVRGEIEIALLDSEDFEGELEAEAEGGRDPGQG